jgi:hypothetical protein
MALATAIGAILPKNFVGWSRRYEHNYNFIQGLAGGLRMVDAPEDVEPNLFALMLEEAKKFSALIGVADSTILEIYTCPTDWEFILKMDALLETAVRKLVKVALTGSELIDNNKLEAFVDALPMRGRSGLLPVRLTPA